MEPSLSTRFDPSVEAHVLLGLARASIASALGGPAPSLPEGAAYHQPGATFVTVHRGASLQGCIGSLEAHRPLARDVCANAVAAALADPRGIALEARDLASLRIEVSLLSPLERLPAASEAEAVRAIRPGVDGVVVARGTHRATFLPQVWASLPDPLAFLHALEQKAGLAPGSWDASTRLFRYAVRVFDEGAPDGERVFDEGAPGGERVFDEGAPRGVGVS